ncbi:CotH kinase family protein [Acetobacterium wieringae]|uniref:CotH kinase family protein n=1 Tax=Acetobacterium wieringae TaxID=52694 RepID=A0ABY6HCY8_9FIRM|nr:CotH kinase family protein [Acetobacterium wieringae]UYO62354.1 CotH kinase family protein [Acetobacterium wieringae]VUZ22996.1 Uncharacterised protein [Acetobacterium wieringae]
MSDKRIIGSSVRAILATVFLLVVLTGTVNGAGVNSVVYDDSAKSLSVTFDNNYASGWMIDICRDEPGDDPVGSFEASVAQLYVERTSGLQSGTQIIDLSAVLATIPDGENTQIYVSAYTPEEDTTIEDGDAGYQGNACVAVKGTALQPTAVVTPETDPATLAAMSNGIPVLSITMSDTDSNKNNLEYLHADKENKISAMVSLDDSADPNNNFSGASAVIKGRGNFTWSLDKRPYQIKFDSKKAFLGMAPAKTWVLLANHTDRSFARNRLIFDLANDMGLAYSSESRFVDLYINGEYLGNYLICEKVEVGSNRVELKNPDGLLLEMDNHYGTTEPYYFTTTKSGTIFTLKDSVDAADSPEVQQAFAGVQADINELETLLYADDPDWAAISEIIDVDSFVKRYFVDEFAKNIEIGMSSIYFYKDGDSDKLHAGPVWDYDLSLGNIAKGTATEDYAKNITLRVEEGIVRNDWYAQLCRNEEFVARANQLYATDVKKAIDNTDDNLNAVAKLVAGSAENNFGKWPVLGVPTLETTNSRIIEHSFVGEISYLRNWIVDRSNYLAGAYGAEMPTLTYLSHVQNQGWQSAVTTGMQAGTTGQALCLEALELAINSDESAGSLEYSTHVQNIGWQDYVPTGTVAGTTGQALGLEAVKIRLTGELADKYDVYYRIHSQNYGWLGWAKNDEIAGTVGMNLRAEAIQVKLVTKGTFIKNTSNRYFELSTAPVV